MLYTRRAVLRTTLATLPLQDTGTCCCALEGSSFPSRAAQPLPIAFRFQPTAINTHPLIFKCSRHRGTQAASPFHLFPKKSCICDALSPLCHLTARAFALCHLIPARCQCRIPSNRSRIHSAWHPAASCCHSPFPPGTSWVPACPPISAREPAREGELGRSSRTVAGEGGRCCCPPLSSPQGGFSPKATGMESRRT